VIKILDFGVLHLSPELVACIWWRIKSFKADSPRQSNGLRNNPVP
jgi:hypothetical protein